MAWCATVHVCKPSAHLELDQCLVVEALLVPDDLDGIHAVSTEVVALENLHGRLGGSRKFEDRQSDFAGKCDLADPGVPFA